MPTEVTVAKVKNSTLYSVQEKLSDKSSYNGHFLVLNHRSLVKATRVSHSVVPSRHGPAGGRLTALSCLVVASVMYIYPDNINGTTL